MLKAFVGRYILGLPKNPTNTGLDHRIRAVREFESDYDFWTKIILKGALVGVAIAILFYSVMKPNGFRTIKDFRQDYIDTNYPKKFYQHVTPIELNVPTIEPKNLDVGLTIVKPVLAREYTYQDHAGKPYYNAIIAELKIRYVNWQDAAELVAKESGFDPGAINPTSGACGIAQALPCTKMKCSLSDINCQLDWQWDYIANRYGTITKALEFHYANGWY